MSKPPNKQSIEDACAKVEGFDIFNNSVAQQAFFKIAIDYTRGELRQDGIDLFSVAGREDLYGFCRLWLQEHPGIPNDMALIALSHAIRSNALASLRADNKPPKR